MTRGVCIGEGERCPEGSNPWGAAGMPVAYNLANF